MKTLLWISRWIVGLLFIFSGLIKANDPLGLSYKMTEFFEVLDWHALSPYALIFSIAIISFEILAGVAVILGYAYRFFSFLLLLLILFFTFLTGYALFSGKIKECGCFGDCIKLTAKESFIKDLILLGLILFLLAYRKHVQPLFSGYPSVALLILSTLMAIGLQIWVLEHLPVKDCLAYKEGNSIWQKMQLPPGATPDEYATMLVYEKNGVKKEFTEANYPWDDSTWTFVNSESKLVKKGSGQPEILDFSLNDFQGNDYTESVLTASGKTYLLFVKDPQTARTDKKEELQKLKADAQKAGANFYVLTSGTKGQTEQFLKEMGIETPDILTLDGTVSKTAMRSNPGLLLLDDGVVRGKWSFRDYPSYK